jgi:hypothetical protein
MSQTKPHVLLVILTVVFTAGSAFAGNGVRLVTHGGVTMVAGHVRVQFQSPFFGQSDIPKGFRLERRLLELNQTLLEAADPAMQASARQRMNAEYELARCAVLAYDGDEDPRSAAARVAKVSAVTFAEPWYAMEVEGTPNDPLFSQQDGLRTIKMPEAWDVTQGNENVVIAIVDNGVEQGHEDLKNSLWVNTKEVAGNGVDDDGNGYIDDYNGYNFGWKDDGTLPGNTSNSGAGGHGTNVAGIAGATTNNGIGVAGVANKCRIFPLKCGLRGSDKVVYGYEGLIYAAQMGFKVANCSWGTQNSAGSTKQYSAIDQSVIHYCMAMGMVVTSSAGNHGNGVGGSGWLEFNYPSAYDGVIGTGETTPKDKITNTTGLGRNAWVMAPGNGATTTVVGGGYSSSGIAGTSFAAPMSAGAAALVRSRWPSLTPRQVAALLKATADPISVANPALARFIPGRLNVHRAVNTDPATTPGLRVTAVSRRNTKGEETDRYRDGDTLLLYYTVVNDLGQSKELEFTTRLLDGAGWIVTYPQQNTKHAALAAGASAEIGPFRIVIIRMQDRPVMLELAYSDGAYNDRSFDYLPRASRMTTFANEQLTVSVGDQGMFAYAGADFIGNNTPNDGTGFGWLPAMENLAYSSGFLFSEGDRRALKAFNNDSFVSDFTAIKTFTAPETNRCVFSDAKSGSRTIGINVEERVTFPSPSAQAVVLAFTLQSTSTSDLSDVSAGYMFDFDIGSNGDDNRVRRAPEALPVSFRETGEAMMVERDNVPVAIAVAALTSELSFRPQAVGMMMADYVRDGDRLTDEDVITLLNSGTSIQTTLSGDAGVVIGMKFPGTLRQNEQRRFMIVIGVGHTAEEAAEVVRNTVLNPNSVQETANRTLMLWPNPSSGTITTILPEGATRLQVVDALGNRVYDQQISSAQSALHTVDLTQLPMGTYMCRVVALHSVSASPFVIVR